MYARIRDLERDSISLTVQETCVNNAVRDSGEM